jgi:uncharacterized protein
VIKAERKIYEVIVTTLVDDGSVHTAPMGVWEEKGGFVVAPFKPSTTYNNLSRHPECVVNCTDDVRVFAGSVTGRRRWPTRTAYYVRGGFLAQALAHSELIVTEVRETDSRTYFYCQVIYRMNHAPFRGFNRAQSAIIEAAILVSRLAFLSIEEIGRELDILQRTVNKTAGPQEREAWEWLMERVQLYRQEGRVS